jgi:hypothetical protein
MSAWHPLAWQELALPDRKVNSSVDASFRLTDCFQVFLTTVVQRTYCLDVLMEFQADPGAVSVPPEYLGLASALTQSARFVGGSVGIACAGAIVNSKLTSKIPAYIAQAALAAGLPASSLVAFITALAGNDVAAAEAVP